jgi:hypothetical protein
MISFFVAFGNTLLILLLSNRAYKNYVEREVELRKGESWREKEIDDPYELYDEERETEKIDEQEIIKEEKRRGGVLKNRGEIAKTLTTNLSIFRLIAYALLVVGFVSLQNSGNLEIAPYLVGVTVAVLGLSFYSSWRGKTIE